MEYFCRRFGYSIKGQTLDLKVSGLRYLRQSIIALSNSKTIFEPMIYENTADSNLVYTYFKHCLPKLPPNSVVIMDNASYHKSMELKELFKLNNIELMYLPPYSPELNPIEKLWGLAKKELRNYYDYNKTLFENLSIVISSMTGDLRKC